MVNYRIQKSTLSGTLRIPPSKSHTHRAILFALMARGTSIIDNYLDSPDTRKLLTAIEQFGAQVTIKQSRLEITGMGETLPGAMDVIDVGNSGIALRFLAALASLSAETTVITGDHSIREQRPISPLLNALETLGARAYTTRGGLYAPLCVSGPLQGGTATINGADSQFVSALLIASSFCKNAVTLHVENPGEKPWVALTLDWLDKMGLSYTNKNFTKYTVPGNQRIAPFHITIPGDFSTAAFPLCAAAITKSALVVEGLDMNDVQGDKKIVDALRKMGAQIEQKGDTLHVSGKGEMKGTELDLNDFIDALPVLAVTACFALGETTITNAAVARTKECDRIRALTTELRKMGAIVEERDDGLRITGSPLSGAEIDTYSDQRMVLAMSMAALGAKTPSLIRDGASAAKTFPGFAAHFQKLGAHIEVLS